MKKFAGIGKTILTGFAYLAAVVTMISNAALAYIIFAPDTLPKPFYMAYFTPEGGVTPSFSFTGHSSDSEETVPEDESADTVDPDQLLPGQGVTVNTGVMIVNLADPGGRRYIKLNIVLEFAPQDQEYYTLMNEALSGEAESSGDGEESTASPLETYIETYRTKIEDVLFAINDSLITLISSKTYESINTVEGKEALRGEIVQLVNDRLPNYHVIQVYFTEFVVQ